MYLIAGLGNPDRQYEGTRHNVGFEVIDQLAERLFVSVDEKKFRGYYGKGVVNISLRIITVTQKGRSIAKFVKVQAKTAFFKSLYPLSDKKRAFCNLPIYYTAFPLIFQSIASV